MDSRTDDRTGASSIRYPRFDTGERLQVLVSRDGTVEFRGEDATAFVEADNAVYLADVV